MLVVFCFSQHQTNIVSTSRVSRAWSGSGVKLKGGNYLLNKYAVTRAKPKGRNYLTAFGFLLPFGFAELRGAWWGGGSQTWQDVAHTPIRYPPRCVRRQGDASPCPL